MSFNRDLLPDPVSFFESEGLVLQRGKTWRTTSCNFHGGSDSMRINVQSGAWRCMACGKSGGDVLAYVMKAHDLDFVEACKGIGAWVEDGKAGTTTIPESAMDCAIQLTAFYLAEHLRLTGAGRQHRQETNLRMMLEWVQSRGPYVDKKDVLQKSPYRLRQLKADGLGQILIELTRRGYVRECGKSWEVRDVQN